MLILNKLKEMMAVIKELLGICNAELEFLKFSEAMGMSESSNRYDCVNTLGFLGKYQFGMARLCDLGYTTRVGQGYGNDAFEWNKGYSQERFLQDNNLQDAIFRAHVYNLKERVKPYLGLIKDKKIDTSGLIACAHLGGIGGMYKFLIGEDVADSYGTKVSDYAYKFSGYKL